MPFQEEIIDLVNAQLEANTLCDPRFNNGSVNGLAYDAYEDGKIYPGVWDLSGNGIKVCPDDTYPITIYHRILNKTYAANAASVGPRANVITEKTDAKMVVAGWTSKLNLTQEDLEALLVSNFPDHFKPSDYAPLKLQNLSVALVSSNCDRQSVFKEEYKGLDYTIKPEQILFSIRYQIESTYKKGCFIITDCQPSGVLTTA